MRLQNNIVTRKAHLVRDKVHQLNWMRFKDAHKRYVWDGSLPPVDERVLDLAEAAKITAHIANRLDRVELWKLSPYGYECNPFRC